MVDVLCAIFLRHRVVAPISFLLVLAALKIMCSFSLLLHRTSHCISNFLEKDVSACMYKEINNC